MFSAVGLFLGLKSKISYKQNVIYFQFYIRLPNFRLLRSIVFEKSPIRSIPLSILYRLFFETQGRKYGRILSWSCHNNIKFTIELKSNDCLQFLDCNVSRDSSNFMSPVYRKHTFSGQVISYVSYMPFV